MTIKFNHPHMKEQGKPSNSNPDKVLTSMDIINRITLALEGIERTLASVRDHNEQTMTLKLQAAKLELERVKAINYTNELLEGMSETLVVIVQRVDALPLNPPGKDTGKSTDKIRETEASAKSPKTLLLLGIPILLKGLVDGIRYLLLLSYPILFMVLTYSILGELFSSYAVVPTVPTPAAPAGPTPAAPAGFTFDITTALSFLSGVAASSFSYIVQVIRAWNRPQESPNDLPPVPHHPIPALALPHLERARLAPAGRPVLAERVPVSEESRPQTGHPIDPGPTPSSSNELETEHQNRMARDESVLANLPEDQRSYFSNILKQYNLLNRRQEASSSSREIGVEALPSTQEIGVGTIILPPLEELSEHLGKVSNMLTIYGNPLSVIPPESPTSEGEEEEESPILAIRGLFRGDDTDSD